MLINIVKIYATAKQIKKAGKRKCRCGTAEQ